MLKDAAAIATLAVRKIDVARKFYEETLGLAPAGGEGDMRAYRSGSSTLMVYESQFAGTNRATAATWMVGSELESVIQSLKAKGVKFEHYDLPDTRREGDIHVSGKVRVAWFKDPDGTILSIANG
jgi:catechol 2,3-dioxygenase-like lactoylglutathione lyase family enzyme